MTEIHELSARFVRAYTPLSKSGDKEILNLLYKLNDRHLIACPLFTKICSFSGVLTNAEIPKLGSIEDLPFIHSSVFKTFQLQSVPKREIYVQLQSSGTTGSPSIIGLSRENAMLQRLALSKITEDFLQVKRPVMLVIDSKETISRNTHFSARKAGIIGFGQLCSKQFFLLDEKMNIITAVLDSILRSNQKILVFGFTSLVWSTLQKLDISEDQRRSLSVNSLLLHGGGWKRLESQRVSKEMFNSTVSKKLGITDVRNYYGMVEQTGSIFLECEHGFLHENPLSRIICRSPKTLDVEYTNRPGIAQVISPLPVSYPGHSIITDDAITVLGENCCQCGRIGKIFSVQGRTKTSEIRGCSDAH